MWGELYIVGSSGLTGNANWSDYYYQCSSGKTASFKTIAAGTHYFKVTNRMDGNEWSNTNCINSYSGSTISSAGKQSDGDAMYIALTDVSDIDIVATGSGFQVNVTATKCGYYLKYPWGNEHAWTWSSALTDCGDGVYACTGPYNGTTYDYGRRNSDGGAGGAKALTGATTVNSPSTDDKCVFELTYSTGALKITRCNQVNNGNHVYFDNSVSGFTGTLYLVIGHDKPTAYSKVYALTRVAGTNLYHIDLNSDVWTDVTYYAVIGSSSDASTLNDGYNWGSSSLSTKGDGGYTAAYTGNYDLNGTSSSYKTFLITTASSGNGKDMTITYQGGGFGDVQKFNASQAAKKRDTGTDYSDVSGLWPATLKLKGSYMKNATDTARSTITSTTSEDGDGNKTYGAIRSGEVTHTYESLSSSYHFEGWGTGDSPSNTDASYSYNITAATTVYAFFSKLYTLTYATKGEDTGSSLSVFSIDGYSGSTTSGSSIPTGHMITLVATPATGYEVEGWYSDASCTSAYTNGSGGVTIEGGNNTFKLASLNANSGVYPKFGPKTYTIKLEDMEPTTEGQGSVSVTYNASTNMTASDPITKPTKTNYDFGGYWVRNEETKALVTKLIDENGKWIADVDGYTSHDGDDPTWVHDYAISLYAKWEEKTHTVSVAVSAGDYSGTPGTVQINSVDVTEVTAGEVTWSTVMTPVANPGWKFKEWQGTSNVDLDLVTYHRDYQTSGTNSMRIKATADAQTITAVFEPRYYLVGGELVGDDDNITTSGMPGWGNYDAPFIVTTSSPLLATCTRTLTNADKTYKILVRDKNDGISYGVNTDPFEVIQDGESLLFDDANYKVFLYAKGGTTFTFKITDVDASGHPYVSLDRPHQMHMGHKRVDIDGTDHNDDTGGTLTATIGETPISNNAWFNYGSNITYTASAQSGYTLKWYTNSDYSSAFSPQPAASWPHNNVTGDENVYAKFTEKATTVNLANDGHGKVQISDEDQTNTTCGVTTHRELTAVPNDGYMFSSWTKTSGLDYDLSTTSDATTTLTGLGGGESFGQTVTANFALRWALKAESVGWGSESFNIDNISTIGGDAVGYVDISLAANTNYQFTITDKQGSGATYYSGSDQVYYMTNGNSYVWGFGTDKSYNCGITTAGAGTYRFMWNITDKTMSVIYPNFVIYRTGDKDEDSESASHTTTSAVESYDDEDPIAQAIEFRMKVRELDKWYTLSLPFTVNKVCVWDADDQQYYPLVPYYRTSVGETLNGGHYIIRTPNFADGNSIALAEFGDWRDPTSPTGYNPSANTPYIIQWHMSYFNGKYISFFGATGQTIPTSMTAGSAPSSDNVVNVCVNNSMTTGSAKGAYLLDPDYGAGAWLRAEDADDDRTILPFECYLLANNTTRAKYRVIRRDMTITDTPTGWEQVGTPNRDKTAKVLIDGQLYIIRGDNMYTIQGALVK